MTKGPDQKIGNRPEQAIISTTEARNGRRVIIFDAGINTDVPPGESCALPKVIDLASVLENVKVVPFRRPAIPYRKT